MIRIFLLSTIIEKLIIMRAMNIRKNVGLDNIKVGETLTKINRTYENLTYYAHPAMLIAIYKYVNL